MVSGERLRSRWTVLMPLPGVSADTMQT